MSPNTLPAVVGVEVCPLRPKLAGRSRDDRAHSAVADPRTAGRRPSIRVPAVGGDFGLSIYLLRFATAKRGLLAVQVACFFFASREAVSPEPSPQPSPGDRSGEEHIDTRFPRALRWRRRGWSPWARSSLP